MRRVVLHCCKVTSGLQNRPNARLGSSLENLYRQTLAARIQPKFLKEYLFLTKAFLEDSYLVSAQDFWQQLQPLIQSELSSELRWDLVRVIWLSERSLKVAVLEQLNLAGY